MRDIYGPLEIDEEWDQRAPMMEGNSATATLDAPASSELVQQPLSPTEAEQTPVAEQPQEGAGMEQLQQSEPAEAMQPQTMDSSENELTQSDIVGSSDVKVSPIVDQPEESLVDNQAEDTAENITEAAVSNDTNESPNFYSETGNSQDSEGTPDMDIKIGLNKQPDEQDSTDTPEAGDIFTPSTVIESEDTIEPEIAEPISEESADLPHSPLDKSEETDPSEDSSDEQSEIKDTSNAQLASLRRQIARTIENQRKNLEVLLKEAKQKRDKAQSDVESAQSEVEKYDKEISDIEDDLSQLAS